MHIIDQKGKLFGKLNIIDLLAIVLIIAVAAFLGMKLTGGQSEGLAAGQSVVYTVEVEGVDAAVYESIQAQVAQGPCQLVANEQLQNGYVTKVEGTMVEEEGIYTVDQYGKTTLKVDEPGTYDVVFTIEGVVNDDVTSKLGSQEIRVGRTHVVKTATFELEEGVILTCERGELGAV